jgi:hypothetical protein
MRTVSSLVAVVALVLSASSLLVIGVGALFALLLFFPLSVLALLGVLTSLEDRTVRQHTPSTDPTRWRHGF